MTGKVIATKLNTMRDGILGVINNREIQNKLTTFGYTPERMVEGKQLLDSATKFMMVHIEEYSDQYSATSDVNKQLTSAYANYMVTLKVVRVAFKSQPDRLARFNATGKRNKSLSGWLRDAKVLYTNLLNLPDALEAMLLFGFTTERLQQELQEVNMVEQLHSSQLKEKSEAQQATQERDAIFDELSNWYSDFRAIARIALYEKPQMLEALGIVKK